MRNECLELEIDLPSLLGCLKVVSKSVWFSTCTVSRITGGRLSELVDIIVALTLLDLDGGGAESAAFLLPVAADFAGDDAVPPPRVRPSQPQRRVGAAFVHRDAPLRHLQTLSFVEETIPACHS